MGTLEMKKELHDIIDREDISTLENIYGLIKKYISHKEECRMIEEAEEDIAAGRIIPHDEAMKIIYSWKK